MFIRNIKSNISRHKFWHSYSNPENLAALSAAVDLLVDFVYEVPGDEGSWQDQEDVKHDADMDRVMEFLDSLQYYLTYLTSKHSQ